MNDALWAYLTVQVTRQWAEADGKNEEWKNWIEGEERYHDCAGIVWEFCKKLKGLKWQGKINFWTCFLNLIKNVVLEKRLNWKYF